jgi:nucleoside 2-deoxyribosyltransferase
MEGSYSVKVYISGPVRGKPFFNFAAFDDAAATLAELGYTPISPAEISRHLVRECGFDPTDEASYAKIRDETYMEEDIRAMRHADCVVLLPGYRRSNGVKVEIAYAKYRGILVYPLADFLLVDRIAKEASA